MQQTCHVRPRSLYIRDVHPEMHTTLVHLLATYVDPSECTQLPPGAAAVHVLRHSSPCSYLQQAAFKFRSLDELSMTAVTTMSSGIGNSHQEVPFAKLIECAVIAKGVGAPDSMVHPFPCSSPAKICSKVNPR